jgi:predicted permease
MLKRAVLWLRSNMMRRRYEREMRDEMSEHIERSTHRLMARGLSHADAQKQAIREFGNLAYQHTEARDARGTLWLDDLAGDARFAFRHFARKPGTTVLMLIVLAAGMSVSTLLFSWVHGMAVMPPPAVALQSDLVRIRGTETDASGSGVRRFSQSEFDAYRGLTTHFDAVAGWIDDTGVLQVPDDPERIGYDADLVFVTDNYFRTIGVQPVLGGGLRAAADDDGAANATAVIDHQAWKTLFQQRRDVIGSRITVNGVALTIVGVAPEQFTGLRSLQGIQLWLPLAMHHELVSTSRTEYSAVGRLRRGVTLEAAAAAVQTVATRFDTTASRPDVAKPSTDIVPLLAANLDPGFDEEMGLIALLIAALGAIVLAVTCTNVSALLTGLASARRQEIAVRLSLGAARARIIRQLLTESAVLAVIAGAAALGIVALIFRLATAFVPDLPITLAIQWPTTAFTFSIALAVGVVFGLSPALHATRLALAGVLRDSGAGIASSRARLQRGLVVAQIAFTQPLIVLMATMVVFVATIARPTTGSDFAERVIKLDVRTPAAVAFDASDESQRRQRDLMLRLRDQISATPGVENAVIEWPDVSFPGDYAVRRGDEAGGVKAATAGVAVQVIEPGHFDVLGIPLKAGRRFDDTDLAPGATRTERPAIIGTDLAALMWGSANPVGRRLQITTDSLQNAPGATLVVVGVVDDPIARTRVAGESYRIYSPADIAIGSYSSMLIRTATDAAPMLPAIRGLVQNNVASAVVNAQTLAQIEEEMNRATQRVSAAISAAGMAALLLSAIGLYAVIAFAVAQRTHEIAVRLAVGARGNQIATSFVGDGLRLGALGLLLGLPAGMFAMRQLIVSMGMGQLPAIPIIVTATLGIIAVAAVSAWAPARRAAAVDPATTLRG